MSQIGRSWINIDLYNRTSNAHTLAPIAQSVSALDFKFKRAVEGSRPACCCCCDFYVFVVCEFGIDSQS